MGPWPRRPTGHKAQDNARKRAHTTSMNRRALLAALLFAGSPCLWTDAWAQRVRVSGDIPSGQGLTPTVAPGVQGVGAVVVPLLNAPVSLVPTTIALSPSAPAPAAVNVEAGPLQSALPALSPLTQLAEFDAKPQAQGVPAASPSGGSAPGVETQARAAGARFDGLAFKESAESAVAVPAGGLQTKIDARITALQDYADKMVRHYTDQGLAVPDFAGKGPLAELAVLKAYRQRLVRVNEEISRQGRTVGELDAETPTEIFEVASGSLEANSGKKVRQMLTFLRAEAKKRGKTLVFFIDPNLAEKKTMDRLGRLGQQQGVQVEFRPIPW